jgi:hypothetical protein
MAMTENQLQKQIVDWIRFCVPSVIVFAIPNAARRTRGGRASNAVPGLMPGAPDLCCMLPQGRVLWLELKTAKGTTSPQQEAFAELARIRGHVYRVCRSVDHVRAAFVACDVHIREIVNDHNINSDCSR